MRADLVPGNPSPDLRLPEHTGRELPLSEIAAAQAVWAAGGAAPHAGIGGEAIWIREDAEGREFQDGIPAGEVPQPGAQLGRSLVGGRPWIAREVEHTDGRIAVHLRKGGRPDTSPLVRHRVVAPR
jgi:hypothetical protein